MTDGWENQEMRELLRRGAPADGVDDTRLARLDGAIRTRLAQPPPSAGVWLSHARAATFGVGIFLAGLGVGVTLATSSSRLSPPVVPQEPLKHSPPPLTSSPSRDEAGALEAVERPKGLPSGVVPPSSPSEEPSSVVRPRAAASAVAAPSVESPASSASAPAGEARQASTAERALLDAGRMALSRGDSGAAFSAVAEHERRYPNGALAEEREVLRIRALVQAGRRDEAREKASRFRATYRESVFSRGIDSILDGGNERDR